MDQYTLIPDAPIHVHLLQGCCLEAERADRVASGLDGLRAALAESLHPHLVAVAEEVRRSARLLRELADRSQVHTARVPVVLDHLNVVLPCMSRTLRDVARYYDNKTFTREIRWRKMYHEMAKEAGGITLPQRFMLYNDLLGLLMQLLVRSPKFEFNRLDTLRSRVMELRERRNIAPPTQLAGPLVRQEAMLMMAPVQDRNVHWAEKIFSLPLPSRTQMKTLKPSRVYPPVFPSSQAQASIPPDSKILFWRPFDNDHLSVTVFINSVNDSPYVLVRTYDGGNSWLALRGVHELYVHRVGSALQLKRWSQTSQGLKSWAVLYFLTWEELVLFYCTFVALKAHNPLTIQVHPREFKLHAEKRLFQAQIIDDGYQHSLIVYEDQETHGIRLHAAVWEGELRQCPVWTAFVTHQAASPTWLTLKSKRRVWLRDVKLYVFCQKYREENMRQNRAGAFELFFAAEEGAQRFIELFYPPSGSVSSDAISP